MAYPASALNTAYAFAALNASAKRLMDSVTIIRAEAAVQNIARPRFIGLIGEIAQAVAQWDILAATPGLAVYAQAQLNDPTIDIVVEYTAMRIAAVTLRDWIFNNFPTDVGTGAVLELTVDNMGVRTPLYFTPAQLTGFVTAADAYLLTVS